MRAKRTHQVSIYETFAEHAIGQELKAISEWLDRHVVLSKRGHPLADLPPPPAVGGRLMIFRFELFYAAHHKHPRTKAKQVVP